MKKTGSSSIRNRIYRQMSFSDKWREVEKLRHFAWEVKKAAVKAKHPDWSEEQLEEKVKKIFLYATT